MGDRGKATFWQELARRNVLRVAAAYAVAYHHPGQSLWGPSNAPARKTERFKALMRKAGLVDYWRARGWPDECHPVGADNFECS